MSDPSFVLSGAGGTLVAHGLRTAYPDVASARAALLSGDEPIIMGALPFDVSSPAALMAPESHQFDGPPLPALPLKPLPTARIVATVPAADEHGARIARALVALRDSGNDLRKVVLARALDIAFEAPVDAVTVLGRLAAADPSAFSYLADLTPAGGAYRGRVLVGASPELLVSRTGDTVMCRPFAGSAPRSADPSTDAASGAALVDSAKNLFEHSLVVDEMAKVLDVLCTGLQVAPAPQLTSTAALWHLSTPIQGTLRDTSATALDLALALHPTPAVGGVPADAAAAVIANLEGDRGFYAGATGWCDRSGDGRWVVSIRCADLSADRLGARAYSGGGIVAESDVDDEINETTTKFRTILSAMGVSA
ncbi:MAG: isochorismate synthase [Mycobacterium sp.]|jgi:isochorismate synthase|nr:isochorismate synthase [Mycobacterium sp.]